MTQLDSNTAWTPGQLAGAAAWNYTLSSADVAELDAALGHAASLGLALEDLRAADFPLPRMGDMLARIGADIEHGVGAARISGVPVQGYSESQQRLLFWGVAQHLGTCVSQSDSGELIMEIRDAGGDPDDPAVRGVHSRGGLHYHTDLCDVVGMLSLHTAAQGGQSMLVSSLAVHDEIARTRPELLDALYRPYRYARPQWDGHPGAAHDLRPVFCIHRGRFVSTYLRDFIEWAQDDPDVPRLEPLQREALDYLDQVCADPRFSFTFMLEAGDLLFFNSFVTYHSRKPYTNHPERERKLLRLWLSVPDSRELPSTYACSFGKVQAGTLRGGIPARSNAEVAA